jgi:hypothetical protein
MAESRGSDSKGRDKIKITGNGKVPKMVNGETVSNKWLRAEVR